VSSGHLRRAGAQRIPEQWRHDLDGIEQEEESASFKAAENAGRRFYAMYSTCLFCHTTLGANEAVEHFPVGRRLAFDAAKGRLWVVCRKCERWNLTPIEERWEAIEECERSFRDTRLRVSTDQIGMSRLSEGLELVRIGKPLRPEFAAWRLWRSVRKQASPQVPEGCRRSSWRGSHPTPWRSRWSLDRRRKLFGDP
jgi:hypothetical protein